MSLVEKLQGNERSELLMLPRAAISFFVLEKEVTVTAFFQNSQHDIWVSFQVSNRNEFEISDGVVLGCKSQQRGLYLWHESVTRHVSEES